MAINTSGEVSCYNKTLSVLNFDLAYVKGSILRGDIFFRSIRVPAARGSFRQPLNYLTIRDQKNLAGWRQESFKTALMERSIKPYGPGKGLLANESSPMSRNGTPYTPFFSLMTIPFRRPVS